MSNNEILTPEVIDWIGQRASFVILNGTVKGIHAYFDYENCVARFKERWPKLPVLLYAWCELGHKTPRTGGLYFETLEAHPKWLIRLADGKPYTARQGMRVSTDVTSPEFRAWFIPEVAKNVERFGTDGVAFDCTLNELKVPRNKTADFFFNGSELQENYAAGLRELLLGVKKAIEPKYVLFNGLFSKLGRLPRQEKLLAYTDAAAVEFFGRSVSVREGKEKESAPFEEFVSGYLRVMQKHPDKIFTVFGRSPRYVYLDYVEDYQIQRYCLASYLLGMTRLSTFKYHSNFQTTYSPPGRTYGMSYYADFDLDLGTPTGKMEVRKGVCFRRFSQGLVLVAPMHQGGGAFELDREYFTPEGERQAGTVAVSQGQGMLLLTDEPATPPHQVVIDDFEDGKPGEWKFPVEDEGTRLLEEKGNRFLRIVTADGAVRPYHERRVQPVRSLIAYDRISFSIRSNDAAGAVLIRVEVSDSSPAPPLSARRDKRGRPLAKGETRKPYVVLVISPKHGKTSFPSEHRDIPYGQSTAGGRAPFLTCESAAYAADATWQQIEVDIRSFLAERAPRFTAHRISEMRILGHCDLDDVAIYRVRE